VGELKAGKCGNAKQASKQAGKGEGQEKGVAGDDIMVDGGGGCRHDAVPACPAPAPMCFFFNVFNNNDLI
jgi:hypothetical protein